MEQVLPQHQTAKVALHAAVVAGAEHGEQFVVVQPLEAVVVRRNLWCDASVFCLLHTGQKPGWLPKLQRW